MTENDIKGFRAFLESEVKDDGKHYETAAIRTRIEKLQKAEEIVGNVNSIVQSDRLMYKALLKLRDEDNLDHAPLQNALRRYWKYKNKKEFPKLEEYERMHGIVKEW